jgi:NaMN:DMB phosphoribosyltransferase
MDSSKLRKEVVEKMPMEASAQDKANALQLLERRGDLDIAEMLGLLE